MPRPDFPRTIVEFQQWFPDDEACAEYLFESRWPEGFRCPRCGHGHCWPVSKRRVLLECAGCHLQTSLTAGTVLHKTRTPLHLLVLGGLPDEYADARNLGVAAAAPARARSL